ncbi:MAG TPA: hypothetical protein IAB39_10425 [Candidatus Onthovicinus excrementipullorum]|nr:hypothetical protein [Candidatus Onthovicinus excrementipullorum]
MRTIILYGDCGDSRLTFPLCRALEQYGGVIRLNRGNIGEYSTAAPEFLLYETDVLESVQTDGGLLLLKEGAAVPKAVTSACGIAALILPDSIPAGEVLPADVPVLRCGTRDEDEIALSSLEEQCAIVTLRRTLEIGDRLCEPHDIHITLTHPTDPCALTVCCAVLTAVLGGDRDSFQI